MYKYTIDNDTTKKLVTLTKNHSNGEKIDKLLKDLKKYNDKFNIKENIEEGLNEKPTFERLEQIKVDEESIKQDAENQLYDYKEENIEKINNAKKTKEKEYQENIDTLNKSYEETMGNMAAYYDNIRQKASDDALDRGLARSSIIINKLDAFNQDELKNFQKLNEDLSSKVNELDFKINALENEQQQALADFDIAYAVKLNTKITQLTKDLNDKQTEILKYNNDIAKAEADYEIKYANMINDLSSDNWEKEMDLLDIATKYGTSMIDKYKQGQMYNMAKSYFLDSGMEKEEIINLLNNNSEFKNLLGTVNINKLLNDLQ